MCNFSASLYQKKTANKLLPTCLDCSKTSVANGPAPESTSVRIGHHIHANPPGLLRLEPNSEGPLPK